MRKARPVPVLRPGDEPMHYSDSSHRWIAPPDILQTHWDKMVRAHLNEHQTTMGGPAVRERPCALPLAIPSLPLAEDLVLWSASIAELAARWGEREETVRRALRRGRRGDVPAPSQVPGSYPRCYPVAAADRWWKAPGRPAGR